MKSTLTDALMALRPGAEFSITDENLDNLVWHTADITTPTVEEIEAKREEIDTEMATKLDARQNALSKLAALGLTADEIAAL